MVEPRVIAIDEFVLIEVFRVQAAQLTRHSLNAFNRIARRVVSRTCLRPVTIHPVGLLLQCRIKSRHDVVGSCARASLRIDNHQIAACKLRFGDSSYRHLNVSRKIFRDVLKTFNISLNATSSSALPFGIRADNCVRSGVRIVTSNDSYRLHLLTFVSKLVKNIALHTFFVCFKLFRYPSGVCDLELYARCTSFLPIQIGKHLNNL